MDRWKSGQVEEWIGGQLKEQIGGKVDRWNRGYEEDQICGRLDRWKTGQAEKWIGGRLDRRKSGQAEEWIGGQVEEWISPSHMHYGKVEVTEYDYGSSSGVVFVSGSVVCHLRISVFPHLSLVAVVELCKIDQICPKQQNKRMR